MSADTALTLATIRALGQRRAELIEASMLRSHQEHLFLAGLDKLGLRHDPSDAIRCARYHCLSNVLGGLRMRYAVESDAKAWVFYETPSWLDSPWSPGMAGAVIRPQFMIGVMRAWHANNGHLLGNPGLLFAVTELTSRGDGRDAGYFLDLGRPVPVRDRLRLRFGEQPPPGTDLREADLDPVTWPRTRQAKAWRNYAVGYAAARVSWLLGNAGEKAAEIIEFGFRTALFQRSEALAAKLGLADLEPGRRSVSVFAEVHRLAGLDVDSDVDQLGATVRIAGSWLDRAPQGIPPTARAVAEAALASAWAAWVRHADRSLELRREAEGSGSRWTFRSIDQ